MAELKPEEIYPSAKASSTEESVDEAQLAQDMIGFMKSGAPEGYYPDKKNPADPDNPIPRTGEPLTWPHIVALAMAGRDISLTAKRVKEEIQADSKNMRAINPADYSTETAYKSALAAVAKHLSPTEWVAGMKAQHGVGTWADLKNATKPKEA